jgi:ferredoxin-NADP reductase
MPLTLFPITLQESLMITPKVKHFVFTCELTPPFHYIPGQFITIHFQKDGKELKRSYSIANEPNSTNKIEFAAGFVAGGPGTELLFHLNPGDTLNISGPYGRLILKEEQPKRTILVATSTGITPFRAMLGSLDAQLKQHPSLQVVILLGVQKREEILYANEFNNFAATHPQATFRACLSRENTASLQDSERQGYVQHTFPDLNLNPEQDLVYLCGNPSMIDDAFNYLKERGFATQQVIREKYISR